MTERGASPGREDPPLVSVVLPAFEVEDYVGECLESILAQTYPRLETIVLDDASSDGTAEVVARYEDRVRVVRQSENRGIYATANHGIRMARGEFVAFYHSDDVYEPEIVEREVEAFRRHPEVGAVFALDTFIDDEGRPYHRLEPPESVPLDRPMSYPELLDNFLRHKNPFLRCPTAMVRRGVWEDVGLFAPERWKNTSDVDMWIRLARERPILIVGEHLLRYRHFHGSSAQRYHHLRAEPNRFFAILDHYLEEEGDRELADEEALQAYEAHRAEDVLHVAVARYIQGDLEAARDALASITLGQLWGTSNVDRGRLSVLLLLMRALCRLPRIPPLADAFYRRWHASPGVSADG